MAASSHAACHPKSSLACQRRAKLGADAIIAALWEKCSDPADARAAGTSKVSGTINKARACQSMQNSGEGLVKPMNGAMQDQGARLSPPSAREGAG